MLDGSVVVVTPMSTMGLRTSDRDFADLLAEAGADVELVGLDPSQRGVVGRGPLRIGVLADLVQSWQLRTAVLAALHQHTGPTAVVFTTTGGTFFVPAEILRHSAVRFDALSCENRRGVSGLPARLLERRAMRHVRVLFPLSSVKGAGLRRDKFYSARRRVIPMPPPIDKAPVRSDYPDGDIQAPLSWPSECLAYVGDPWKKGLDLLVEGFQGVDPHVAARLTIVGVEPGRARSYLSARGVVVDDCRVTFTGPLERSQFLSLLASAKLYVSSSRYEDFGAAQLEAVHAGALIIATPAAGPFEAGRILRNVDPALIAGDMSAAALGRAITYGLSLDDAEREIRREQFAAALEPFLIDSLRHRVRAVVMPELAHLARREER